MHRTEVSADRLLKRNWRAISFATAMLAIAAWSLASGLLTLAVDSAREHPYRPRIVAVALASVDAFMLARTGGPVALVAMPALPFTATGLADHVTGHRALRAAHRSRPGLSGAPRPAA